MNSHAAEMEDRNFSHGKRCDAESEARSAGLGYRFVNSRLTPGAGPQAFFSSTKVEKEHLAVWVEKIKLTHPGVAHAWST